MRIFGIFVCHVTLVSPIIPPPLRKMFPVPSIWLIVGSRLFIIHEKVKLLKIC